MPQYSIQLAWDASSDHEGYTWTLDDGTRMVAVAPDGTASGFMDPEQAFAASIASCHLLSFVTEAARRGFSVQRYEDEPIALLARGDDGAVFVGRVVLAPRVAFGRERAPDHHEVRAMHDQARRKCIISNSVHTRVDLHPRFE